jgi:uncharacterized membrane protein
MTENARSLADLPRRSARKTPTLTWHEAAAEELTLGDRAADALRKVMGSWGFVGFFLLVMAVWWVLNTVSGAAWDPYPFILLNLFLSMLAGLQGAILLIAAKRQDAIAAALAQHDFNTNVAAKVDIEALLEINRRQLEIIIELRHIADAQHNQADAHTE